MMKVDRMKNKMVTVIIILNNNFACQLYCHMTHSPNIEHTKGLVDNLEGYLASLIHIYKYLYCGY